MNGTNPRPGSAGRITRAAIDLRGLAAYWPPATVTLLAVLVRSFIWLNSDVSWLLTLAEKVVGGARPYVDFSETNPPASILLYVPAIMLSRATGVSAECALTILTFVAAFLCLVLVGRVLPGTVLAESREKLMLFALALALLLILPGDNFAERENIALMAVLPMLAVYAARANAIPVGAYLAGLAGMGGGIAVAIKPYFAFALILPMLFVAWQRRSDLKALAKVVFSPEHLTALLVVLTYGVLLIWVFSDYTQHTLPIVLTLYVPLKYSLLLMIGNPSVILVAMLMIVSIFLGRSEFATPLIRVACLAALGFTGALIAQGKGWPYHGYPAVALSLLILSLLLVKRLSLFRDTGGTVRAQAIDLGFGAALLATLYALASFWLLQEPSRARLVTEVAQLVPVHPRIISIEGGPGVAFPLTRKLRGTAIGRTPFQWVSAFTNRMLTVGELDRGGTHKILDPVLRHRLEEYARLDRQELADSIRTGKPDVVLIGGKVERLWALSHPEIAAALRAYRMAKTVDGVEIWLPRRPSGGLRQN